MTIHVAVFGHSADLAGAELSLLFCVKRMLAARMRVTVFLPTTGQLTKRLEDLRGDLEIETIPLGWWMGRRHRHIIGLLRTSQALLDTFRVWQVLKKLKPDISLTISSVTPAPLLASKMLGIPSILTLGESLRSNPTLKSFFPKSVIARIINKSANKVLACSKYVSNQYGFENEISYPEIQEFMVTKPRTRSLKVPKIVMLGSYSSEKGQDLAVEVARELSERNFPYRLEFYGWGNEIFLQELEDRVSRYGLKERVSFKKPTSDVYEVLQNSELSLVLSKNEAFGKVTLESLSQATPVIGLDAGGTSEILNEGGGKLVPPNSAEIAETIMSLCSSPIEYRQMQFAAISNPILYQIVGTRRDICSHILELSNSIENSTDTNERPH